MPKKGSAISRIEKSFNEAIDMDLAYIRQIDGKTRVSVSDFTAAMFEKNIDGQLLQTALNVIECTLPEKDSVNLILLKATDPFGTKINLPAIQTVTYNIKVSDIEGRIEVLSQLGAMIVLNLYYYYVMTVLLLNKDNQRYNEFRNGLHWFQSLIKLLSKEEAEKVGRLQP